MSSRDDAPVESDMTQACREMIAQLARRAKERRARAATDRPAQRGEEPHEP